MEKRQNIFLKIGKALFGLLFICFIIACLAGLFKFLYFHETSTAVPEQKAVNRFTKTIDESISAKEHFHMLDEKVYSDFQNAPVCLRCHGNFCHTKSKELRSFYNMHTFYIA